MIYIHYDPNRVMDEIKVKSVGRRNSQLLNEKAANSYTVRIHNYCALFHVHHRFSVCFFLNYISLGLGKIYFKHLDKPESNYKRDFFSFLVYLKNTCVCKDEPSSMMLSWKK